MNEGTQGFIVMHWLSDKHNGMQGSQCQENGEEGAEPSLLVRLSCSPSTAEYVQGTRGVTNTGTIHTWAAEVKKKKLRARGQALHIGIMMIQRHTHSKLSHSSLLGRRRSLKEALFCALLVSITTECKQSQAVPQNGTVVLRGGIQPPAARSNGWKGGFMPGW